MMGMPNIIAKVSRRGDLDELLRDHREESEKEKRSRIISEVSSSLHQVDEGVFQIGITSVQVRVTGGKARWPSPARHDRDIT